MCYHYTKCEDPRTRSQGIRGLVSIFHRVPAMILDERAQEVFKATLAEREVLPRTTLLKSLRVLREVWRGNSKHHGEIKLHRVTPSAFCYYAYPSIGFLFTFRPKKRNAKLQIFLKNWKKKSQLEGPSDHNTMRRRELHLYRNPKSYHVHPPAAI